MPTIVFSGYNGAKGASKVWALMRHKDGTTSTAWGAVPIRATAIRISCRKAMGPAAVRALVQSKRAKGYSSSAAPARAFQQWLKRRAREDAALVMCPEERSKGRRLAVTATAQDLPVLFVFYDNPGGHRWEYSKTWGQYWTGKGGTKNPRYPAEEQFNISKERVADLRAYLHGFFTKLRDAKKIARFKIRRAYARA